ncbi:MAG: hypothetical protein ACRDJM_08900, partial [Actinomycetota bacterium]
MIDLLLRRRNVVAPIVATAMLAGLAFLPGSGVFNAAARCAPGFHPVGWEEARLSQYGDLLGESPSWGCINDKHPETAAELDAMARERWSMQSAPDGIVPAGARDAALRQRAALLRRGQSKTHANTWAPVGNGPLQAADPGYNSVNLLGNVELNGRITDFAYIPPSDTKYPDTLLASVSYGGIWASDSSAGNWISIGDTLPTQAVGS